MGLFDGITNKIGYGGLQVAGKIQTYDATTGTVITSPKTGVTTVPLAFVTPPNAVVFTFKSTADCRYGDNATLDGSAGKGYKKGTSSVDIRVPCNSMSSVYIRAETGTVDIDFFFEVLVLS